MIDWKCRNTLYCQLMHIFWPQNQISAALKEAKCVVASVCLNTDKPQTSFFSLSLFKLYLLSDLSGDQHFSTVSGPSSLTLILIFTVYDGKKLWAEQQKSQDNPSSLSCGNSLKYSLQLHREFSDLAPRTWVEGLWRVDRGHDNPGLENKYVITRNLRPWISKQNLTNMLGGTEKNQLEGTNSIIMMFFLRC